MVVGHRRYYDDKFDMSRWLKEWTDCHNKVHNNQCWEENNDKEGE